MADLGGSRTGGNGANGGEGSPFSLFSPVQIGGHTIDPEDIVRLIRKTLTTVNVARFLEGLAE